MTVILRKNLIIICLEMPLGIINHHAKFKNGWTYCSWNKTCLMNKLAARRKTKRFQACSIAFFFVLNHIPECCKIITKLLVYFWIRYLFSSHLVMRFVFLQNRCWIVCCTPYNSRSWLVRRPRLCRVSARPVAPTWASTSADWCRSCSPWTRSASATTRPSVCSRELPSS